MDSGIETAMMSGAPPAAHEEQNHQSGQRSRDDAFTDHATDRAAHEDRLISQRGDLHLRGKNRCSVR